jgi:ribosomal protein S19
MLVKNKKKLSIFKKKGRFLHPIIYAFAKTNKKIFLTNKNFTLNIRSSSFIKNFFSRTFSVHTGRRFLINDPIDMRAPLLDYPNYKFKIGQFAFTRTIHQKRYVRPGTLLVLADLKRKEGIIFKPKKKKKYIFSKYGSRS